MSLTPSPTIATTLPSRCSSAMTAALSAGSTSAHTRSMWTRAAMCSDYARDPHERLYLAGQRSFRPTCAQGKRHNQALIALARRRSDVLFAMLRDGTLYRPPTRTD